MVAVAVIPVTAAGVAAAYAAKDLSPVSLGDLMLRCRREQGIAAGVGAAHRDHAGDAASFRGRGLDA